MNLRSRYYALLCLSLLSDCGMINKSSFLRLNRVPGRCDVGLAAIFVRPSDLDRADGSARLNEGGP